MQIPMHEGALSRALERAARRRPCGLCHPWAQEPDGTIGYRRACPRRTFRLAQYLESHIAEEDGHEAWALLDLRRLGHDTAGIGSSLPLVETIGPIGAQQYVIDHVHPAGIFG